MFVHFEYFQVPYHRPFSTGSATRPNYECSHPTITLHHTLLLLGSMHFKTWFIQLNGSYKQKGKIARTGISTWNGHISEFNIWKRRGNIILANTEFFVANILVLKTEEKFRLENLNRKETLVEPVNHHVLFFTMQSLCILSIRISNFLICFISILS